MINEIGPGMGGGPLGQKKPPSLKESFIGNLFDDCSGIWGKNIKAKNIHNESLVQRSSKLERKKLERERKLKQADKRFGDVGNGFGQMNCYENIQSYNGIPF